LTGPGFLWLRNNGATCASQLIDTVLIDLIYLYWGLEMGLSEVIPIMAVSFCYKALFSILNTPLFYGAVFLMKTNHKFN
jgi:queuosine precursor transporter